jgi:hypothetical protein
MNPYTSLATVEEIFAANEWRTRTFDPTSTDPWPVPGDAVDAPDTWNGGIDWLALNRDFS